MAKVSHNPPSVRCATLASTSANACGARPHILTLTGSLSSEELAKVKVSMLEHVKLFLSFDHCSSDFTSQTKQHVLSSRRSASHAGGEAQSIRAESATLLRKCAPADATDVALSKEVHFQAMLQLELT